MMKKVAPSAVYAGLVLCTAVTPLLYYNLAITVRVGTCILLVCGLFWAGYGIREILSCKPHTKFRFTWPDIAVGVLLLYYLIRYFFTPLERSMPEHLVLQFSWFASYGFLRRCFGREGQEATQVLYMILVFGIVQAVFGILQWFHVLPNLFSEYRMGGTFGNPGELANVLVLAYALALGLALEEKHHRKRLVFAGMLILSAIVLSNARTAWVAFLGVSLVTVRKWLFQKFRWLRSRVPAYVPVVGMLVILVVVLVTGLQLYHYKQGSSEGRLFIWQRCMELIGQQPLWGHGYSTFTRIYPLQQTAYFEAHPNDIKNGLLASNILIAYNDYLQLATEYGFLGLGLWLGLLGMVFLSNRAPCKSSTFPGTIQGVVAGVLFCMLFSYPLENYVIPFIILMVLAYYASGIPHTVWEWHITPRTRLFAGITISLISLLAAILGGIGLYYALRWKGVYERFQTGDKSAVKDYAELVSVLRYDKYFCFNYGTALYNAYRFQEAIDWFETYKYHFYDTDLLMLLAESYTMINDDAHAEAYLLKATCLKPHLYEPNNKLFLLYQRTHQNDKAKQMAERIKYMPVKVLSNQVKDYKSQANAYLNSIQTLE